MVDMAAVPNGLINEVTLGVGAAVHLATVVGIVVWKMSRVEISVRSDMQETIKEFNENWQEQHESAMRGTGESLAALRQRINEVEIWGRDNYVRREDRQELREQIQELSRDLKDLTTSVTEAMRRIEERITHH